MCERSHVSENKTYLRSKILVVYQFSFLLKMPSVKKATKKTVKAAPKKKAAAKKTVKKSSKK
jgi:hypothetical protein